MKIILNVLMPRLFRYILTILVLELLMPDLGFFFKVGVITIWVIIGVIE